MKQYSLLLFLLIALCTFSGCEDDDDPLQLVSLTLDFDAEYDDQPLTIQSQNYDYPNNGQVVVQLFQYYVSDLTLLPTAGGDTIHLSEIELIRYMSAIEDNVESREYQVPTGAYNGIRFGLGVKPELNALAPSNFSATDPLNENEFWNDRARYVFAKIEANADLNSNGVFDTGITLHMGSDALYRTVTLNESFTLRPGQASTLTIVTDVLEALGGETNPYDISLPANQTVHGGNQATGAAIFNRLADNFELEQ